MCIWNILSINSDALLRFSMRFEFLSEIYDYSVCETRDPSLTIYQLVSYTSPKWIIVKLGSRSKVYLKSLIRDLDLELVAIIACLHPPPPPRKLF